MNLAGISLNVRSDELETNIGIVAIKSGRTRSSRRRAGNSKPLLVVVVAVLFVTTAAGAFLSQYFSPNGSATMTVTANTTSTATLTSYQTVSVETTIASSAATSTTSVIQSFLTSGESSSSSVAVTQLSTSTTTTSQSSSSQVGGGSPAGFWLYITSVATNAPFQGANVTVTPVVRMNGANVTLSNEQALFTTNATGWVVVNNYDTSLANYGSDSYLSFSVVVAGWRTDYPEWNFSMTFDAYWQPQKVTLLSIIAPYTTVGTWYVAAPSHNSSDGNDNTVRVISKSQALNISASINYGDPDSSPSSVSAQLYVYHYEQFSNTMSYGAKYVIPLDKKTGLPLFPLPPLGNATKVSSSLGGCQVDRYLWMTVAYPTLHSHTGTVYIDAESGNITSPMVNCSA